MADQRKAMHAGEAVAEALREEGVERVYSVPGSHIHVRPLQSRRSAFVSR